MIMIMMMSMIMVSNLYINAATLMVTALDDNKSNLERRGRYGLCAAEWNEGCVIIYHNYYY